MRGVALASSEATTLKLVDPNPRDRDDVVALASSLGDHVEAIDGSATNYRARTLHSPLSRGDHVEASKP
jgi:hypothetical protein